MSASSEGDARGRLIAIREELQQLSEISDESRRPVALDQQSIGRLSRMDAMQQQAMNEATQRSRQRDLNRIDAVLSRVDDGEYGFCLECGEPIAPGRLEVDPMAEKCISCAR